jgi:hypothetical protein
MPAQAFFPALIVFSIDPAETIIDAEAAKAEDQSRYRLLARKKR